MVDTPQPDPDPPEADSPAERSWPVDPDRVGSNPDPVERAIRKAQAEGEFDDLRGAGQPIADLDRPYDPGWWARRWMERERADVAVRDLAGRLRREVPKAVGLSNRSEARLRLEVLNDEIDAVNATSERSEPLERLDIDHLLRHFPD